jgi:hypothetical protein
MKQGLIKIRALLDLKRDFESQDVGRGMLASVRVSELLAPYNHYLKNPSPDNYIKVHKKEGLFFYFLEPYAPASPEDDSPITRMLNAPSIFHPELFPEIIAERVERAYVALYRGLRGSDHRSKAEKTLGIRLANERLKRLKVQNQKLALDMRAREGNLVDREEFMRQVLACNATMKNQLLALPDRVAGELAVMTDPHAIRNRLRTSIIETLNELAYEHGGSSIRK